MEDIQNIANSGEFKEWVIWKMEGFAKKGGRERHRDQKRNREAVDKVGIRD